MAATWDHPVLGRFEHRDCMWTRTIAVPAFAAFTYGSARRGRELSTGTCDVSFEAYDEAELPTAEAVARLDVVLARQHELVSMVTRVLWDDFNGRGPRSGMWWRNGLHSIDGVNSVTEGLEDKDLPPLDGPDALLGWMRLSQIVTWNRDPEREKPLIELSFCAAFEDEHGVGVLTDGVSIVGLGYSCEVDPFDPE